MARLTIPEGEVHLKRNRNARRISLRVSTLDRRITLTAPPHVHQRELISFLDEKRGWLQTQLSGISPRTPISECQHILLAGQRIPIVGARTNHATLDSDNTRMSVPDDPSKRPGAITALLKLMARDRLIAASDRFAHAIGARFNRISLRDTRSRWGSCSANGTLMYSWRLIMAPPDVLSYVAAHEVCHLIHMDHSAAFWRAVAAVDPNHKDAQRWLRENGPALHSIDFGN